jgi:membrane-associated protease RseP (regulator of RpoE activity)
VFHTLALASDLCRGLLFQAIVILSTSTYYLCLFTLSALTIIFVFGFIFTIHEYGHYLAIRILGVIPKTFSIGMGPILYQHKDKHGTDWCVSVLPIGGYVEYEGDNLNRFSVMFIALAGPIANFISSFLLFAGLLLSNQCTLVYNDETHECYIECLNKKFTVNAANYNLPNIENTESSLYKVTDYRCTITDALDSYANIMSNEIIGLQNLAIKLFRQPGEATSKLSGPVGIMHKLSEDTSGPVTLWFCSRLALSIGLMNLFPIPPLDGYIFCSAAIGLMTVRNQLIQNIFVYATQLGATALIGLMGWIMYSDISKIFVKK